MGFDYRGLNFFMLILNNHISTKGHSREGMIFSSSDTTCEGRLFLNTFN